MNDSIKRSKKFNETEKQAIINMDAEGFKRSDIARALNVPPARIRSFFCRKKSLEFTGPKVILRKTKMDSYVGRNVERLAREFPRNGVRKLARIFKQRFPDEGYYPGRSQINRYLLSKGYKSGFKSRAPGLTEKHKLDRIAFAQKWLTDDGDSLGNVIWSDETMIRSHPFTRKQRYRWNPAMGDTAAMQDMEQGGKNSVMFWGCISKHGRGPLVSLLGRQKGKDYGELIEDIIIPEFDAAVTNFPGPWKFMQDGASIHKTKDNLKTLQDAQIPLLDWPSKSPDLNPIENVWAWLKEKLDSEHEPCKNAEELEAVVMKIWVNELTPELCQKFCGNYFKRLSAVLASDGNITKY